MKIIKVATLTSVMVLTTTSLVFASWWNPMSWSWFWFKKSEPQKVVIQQTNTLLASTTDNQKQVTDVSKEVVAIQENDTQKSDSEGQGATTAIAYIVSINDNKITLDYVDVFSDREAIQKAILDGLCKKEEECFGGGISIYNRNISTKLRTFSLSKNVKIFDGRDREITLEILSSPSDRFISRIYKEDSDSSAGRDKKIEHRYGSVFTFTFNDKNEVIKITEHFSP